MTVPHCNMQLQNLAPGLTRLELLPTTTSEWEILPSFTKLHFALLYDVKSDLSWLTQLKVPLEICDEMGGLHMLGP